MDKNKTGKYLKYAIGEIVLVVIGILIALQINNWNEKRIQLAQGQTLMIELINEINSYVATCDRAAEGLRKSLKKQEAIFKEKDLSNLSVDSLNLGFLFDDSNIDIEVTQNTFERMKNQGITHLSEHDSLNQMISIYFSKTVFEFNRRIKFDWNSQLERRKYINEQNSISYGNSVVHGFKDISIKEQELEFINFINLPRTQSNIVQSYFDAKESLETVLKFRRKSIVIITAMHNELLKSNPKLKPLPDFDIKQDSLK